jgi:CRISPR-associated protein (TIGR02710 family)
MAVVTRKHLEDLAAQHNSLKEFGTKKNFYAEQLYPALRDTFAAQPAADPPIEILLLPVSNPHVPVLATARWKPTMMHAIYSSRSVEHQPFIEQEIQALGLDIQCTGQKVLNIEIAPDDLYKAIKEILKPFVRSADDNPHIAVDITGGTSVMSVGAAMAVSLVGGRFFYILSGAAQDDITQRQVGTEDPRPFDDPYTVFGDLEADKARKFYRAHDYAGAKKIFDYLSIRVHDTEKQRYQAYASLSTAYAAWDVFAWDKAAAALATLLESPFPSDLEAVRQQLQDQHTVLQQLTMDTDRWEQKPTLTLLQDQTSVLPLLGSLYANARRREAQGRYDVAALFSYRCLELMSQHRLATWGLLTDQPDYRPLRRRIPDLDERYRVVEERLFDYSRGLPHWKSGISLFNGYMLLDALNDPLVQGVALEQIRERTRARNQSMLAHGFRLITSAEYAPFRAVVEDLLDRFFVVLKDDRLHWEQTYQFVCPFAAEETP